MWRFPAIEMVKCMIPHSMPTRNHLLKDFRVPGYVFPYAKKGGQGIMGAQHFQHKLCGPGHRAIIKSKIDMFLTSVFMPYQ